jgi:hypothetical protein
MVGDTTTVFVKTIFPKGIEVEKEFKIIFE